MDVVFPIAAFLAAFVGTRRSLGVGFMTVFAVGYGSGVVRANFLGVFTTFTFDAAVLGLYAGFLQSAGGATLFNGRAGRFALLLVLWPTALCLLPVNDVFVQLVALRATIWFLPVMLIATRLTGPDLVVLARGLAVLNLCAFAVGVYVYQNGVTALYPENAVTRIIYQSKDVGGFGYYRIPSTFLSAHAYGGAMVMSLPLVLSLLFGAGVAPLDRVLGAAGVVAAAAGILMCAARQPVVTFGLATLVAWACARFHPAFGAAAAAVVAAGLIVAGTDERLQRAATLEDAEVISERVKGSANDSLLELLADHPFGAGMGSSVGTSIPFFLADRAPVAVGLENEYCRILVDQGWVGLAAWLAFLVWLLGRPPAARLQSRWGLAVVLMYALVFTNWATACIGTGMLSSVPGSILLLTQMGILIRVREGTAGPSTTQSMER
jgi:hypothetical protein